LTRRGVLGLAAAAALPDLARAAGGGTLRVEVPNGVGTLDPAKFRVGGMETLYSNCGVSRKVQNLQVLPLMLIDFSQLTFAS
jgi:hypothetical protein